MLQSANDKGRTLRRADEGLGYCASLIPNQDRGSSEWVMLTADGGSKYSIKNSYSAWNTTLCPPSWANSSPLLKGIGAPSS